MQLKPVTSDRVDAVHPSPRVSLLELPRSVGLTVALVCLLASGCCGSGGSSGSSSSGSSNTSTPVSGPRITNVTFAKALNKQMQAQTPTKSFLPHEKVNLSITLAGRPSKGTVKAHFFHRDQSIGDVSIDLSQINKGVLFSLGESTYAGFWYEHEQPLPVGVGYKVDVFVNDQPRGTHTFDVLPPAGALPSKIYSAGLAKGMTADRAPVMPSKVFAPNETVHLVGRLDLGVQNWVEANWYANGQLMPQVTKSLHAQKNIQNQPYFFTVPMKGWPAGQHKAVFIMNGAVVGEYPFTLVGGPAVGQFPVQPGQLPPTGVPVPVKAQTPPPGYAPVPGQIPPAPQPPVPTPPVKTY